MIPDEHNPPLSEEQVHYFARLQEESTTRAVKRAGRRQLRSSLVGFLILLLGVLGYSIAAQNALENSTHKAQSNLIAGLTQSCKRVNILRAQSNNSDYVVWDILTASAKRERYLQRTDLPIAARPVHAQSARVFETAAARLTVTPLTNCDKAVRVPNSYAFPTAGPLGNVKTGELKPEVVQVLRQSNDAVQADGNANRDAG
jgi:hypothetical protein